MLNGRNVEGNAAWPAIKISKQISIWGRKTLKECVNDDMKLLGLQLE